MATWKEVSNDPNYQALPPDAQDRVKRRFFANVIQKDPDYINLPDANKRNVEARFFGGAPAGAVKPTPKEYTLGEAIAQAPRSAAQSAVNLGRSVRDAALHPIDTAGKIGSMALGAASAAGRVAAQPMVNALAPFAARAVGGNSASRRRSAEHIIDLSNRAQVEAVMRTANAMGGLYRERYGSPAAIRRTIAEHPVEMAADLSTLLAGGAGVAGAAGMGRTAGVLNTAAELTNPLSTGNIVARPVRAAARTVGLPTPSVRGTARALSPQNAMVTDMLGDNLRPAHNALRVPREIVPGSVPTAAQAVSHRTQPGRPTATRFAAVGKAAEDRLSDQATAARTARVDARRAQVDTIGRTPAELQAREARRAADYARDRAAYEGVMVTEDAGLRQLMADPLTAAAFRHAETLMQQRRRPFIVQQPPVTNQHGVVTAPGQRQLSGEALHAVKQAYDDLAFDNNLRQHYNIGQSNVHAIRNARNEFIRWVEDPSRNPAYGTARRNYRDHSVEIDRMRLGQRLSSQVDNPAAFSATLAEPILGNTKMKQALGNPMWRNAGELYTPEQMQILRSIEADHVREALAASHAAAGTEHAGMLTSAASRVRLPASFNNSTGLVNSLSHMLTGRADQRIADRVSNAMLTPEGAAGMIDDAMRWDRRVGQAERAAGALGEAGALATRYPALYNALMAQPQESNAAPRQEVYPDQEIDAPVPEIHSSAPRERIAPVSRGGFRPRTSGTVPISHSTRLDPRGPAARWAKHVEAASAATGVPVAILDGVMRQESGGNANALSPAGAIGLMQLMPGTAAGLKVDPRDPAQNILGGARYLKAMHDKFGSWPLALAAYNAGPGALRPSRENPKYMVWEAPYNKGYAETRNYVKNITADINRRYGPIEEQNALIR